MHFVRGGYGALDLAINLPVTVGTLEQSWLRQLFEQNGEGFARGFC